MKRVRVTTLSNSPEQHWVKQFHQKTGSMYSNVHFTACRMPSIELRGDTRALISDQIEEEIL